ncbi:type II toxin-antitoxin system HigB family toxin [Parabacteroides sp. PF5-6]|uniref:type II toxin-antitoxin system HigB family toxin n=1 Tax=Parabacteroides sp. PF5-6 TaxID=1742403 RepID=UPI0024062A41|nr:type II toxin-antitoxin system HigB family toxin [Parabacteroides sp. PF5-6]MDF9831414.1 mRNA interferase HigB [Parabacteroides sp. PF5-6]
MRIIKRKPLVDFYERHTDAKAPLEEWYTKTKKVEWSHFSDVRKTFNSVDSVGNDNYVFNIKGNTYRLIARILFKVKTVYIRFIGTHQEYDEIDDCSKI